MKQYLVIRTIQLSKIISAPNKQVAVELFSEWDADTKLINEKAKLIKPDNVSKVK
jgi:hypothetical protein